jgi:hypothetical protein
MIFFFTQPKKYMLNCLFLLKLSVLVGFYRDQVEIGIPLGIFVAKVASILILEVHEIAFGQGLSVPKIIMVILILNDLSICVHVHDRITDQVFTLDITLGIDEIISLSIRKVKAFE